MYECHVLCTRKRQFTAVQCDQQLIRKGAGCPFQSKSFLPYIKYYFPCDPSIVLFIVH